MRYMKDVSLRLDVRIEEVVERRPDSNMLHPVVSSNASERHEREVNA